MVDPPQGIVSILQSFAFFEADKVVIIPAPTA